MEISRDFVGYGLHPPKVQWPRFARIAINFVLNYEEGAEQNILDGDSESESYLVDLPGVIPLKNKRHLSSESMFEYGSRAGVWRLLELFNKYKITATLFMTGLALERNPELADYLKESLHEIAGHGYRWINYSNVSEDVELEHIYKTIRLIETSTHKKVKGWYTGRRSLNTRKLIVKAGLQYDSDSYADDLPYMVQVSKKSHLVIPYSLETNDARYAIFPGFNSCEDFYLELKNTFDCLYREGSNNPKMMTIGLHSRFSGRPGRSEAVSRFLEYILQFDNIWICRREEISDYWYEEML